MSKKKNSFSFFLDDYVDEQARKGRHISKKIAVEECSPLWKQLPAEVKNKYTDMANKFKTEQDYLKQRAINHVNFSPEEKPRNEISYLTAHIRHEKALRKFCFYFIHCNYYCRTEEGVYIPAEIALVEFNLEDGIKQTYHTLVNPDKIPLGYAFEVKRISDEVHGLPCPPHNEGEKDYDRILTALFHFMKIAKDNEDEYPPLFTVEENVQASNEVLMELSRKAEIEAMTLKVHPIHRMFFWLKNKCTEFCGNEPGFPVLSNAITEIEKDVFRYCTGISCKFHTDLPDKFQNCSLSIVQRLVYVICDHCCRHLRIKLMRGKHLHPNSAKRTGDRSQNSIPSNNSDVTCNNYQIQEPDFWGASSYASSVPGDYRNEVDEEGCEWVPDEGDFRCETESSGVRLDDETPDDWYLMTVRGRGKFAGSVKQTRVGLPRF